jgi:hypothetical protein
LEEPCSEIDSQGFRSVGANDVLASSTIGNARSAGSIFAWKFFFQRCTFRICIFCITF